MYNKLQALDKELALYLDGEITSQDIAFKLTTPVMMDDAFDDLDDNIASIIFESDIWGMNQPLTNTDIKQFRSELSTYLQKMH